MDQRGFLCPFLLSSKTTAKGTGFGVMAGEEDPVELDSSLTLWSVIGGSIGGSVQAKVKNSYIDRRFTYIIVLGLLEWVLFWV